MPAVTTPLWTPPLYSTGLVTSEADTQGEYVSEFAEMFCRHVTNSNAAAYGDPVSLRDWQRWLINQLFELNPDGSRRYRRALVGVGKKNGKTILSSILALYALVADQPGARVFSAAYSKDQARLAFDDAKRMVAASPQLSDSLKIYRDAIEYVPNGSVYRVISADANAQDGINPTFVVFDEVHRQPNEDLWAVMTNGIGTRPNALVLGLTTAGYDKSSLCYRLYEYGKKVATGEESDRSFGFFWWEAHDSSADFKSEEGWYQANPALGDYLSIEDMASLAKFEPENTFRRLRLNQWTQTHSAWLKFGAWDECLNDNRHLEQGEEVVLGFDGSWANDCTALVACATKDYHIEVLAAWEKQPSDDDEWRVDTADVEDAIRSACDQFKVKEIACDPSFWKATLQKLSRERLPMVEYPNSVPRMIQATKAFEDAVYEKRLSHNGDPRLARHISNCIVKQDRRTDSYYISKEQRGGPRKIDLAVASLMAFDRCQTRKQTKKSRSAFMVFDAETNDFEGYDHEVNVF